MLNVYPESSPNIIYVIPAEAGNHPQTALGARAGVDLRL